MEKKRKLMLVTLTCLILLVLSACYGGEHNEIEPLPSPSVTRTSVASCTGTLTGISIQLPASDWKCKVETDDDTNETFHITSPVFDINISTFGRGPFCNNPNQDDSCTSKPFYENKSLSLTSWSTFGELREIFGVKRIMINGQPAPVTFSIRYQGMEHRPLETDEMQQLTKFLDSISFPK